MSNVEIHCAHTDVVHPASLKPHPRNPNSHPAAQLATYQAILAYQGWRRAITVSKLSGFITKGHGAREAALAAGMTSVPVDYQDYPHETAEIADLAADNLLARMSELDVGKLSQIRTTLDVVGVGDMMAITKNELLQLSAPGNATPPIAGGGGVVDSTPQFLIVIECMDETHQRETFEKLVGEGVKCKIM